jgi:hypothetical protein
MNGRQFLGVLRRMHAEELERPIADLVDEHDGSVCLDCGHRHGSPWEALVCDERTDARRRRDAGRSARAIRRAELRLAGPGVRLPDEQDLSA